MAMPDIPMYVFTGFLESGKTKFIQETLEDERFNTGERTLLLVFEEGEEEYDVSAYPHKEVYEQVLDYEDLSPELLTGLQKKYRAERVVVELNGMHLAADFYLKTPDHWKIAQEVMFADATTFLSYNANMRQLVVDKLAGAEMLVLNRMAPGTDVMPYHKIARAVNRKIDILYEYTDGSTHYDDIEDPLPFDLNAPVVEIRDEDYALFYRDITEEPKKYAGKTVKFKGQVARLRREKEGMFAPGRFVMTCCEADITFMGLPCKFAAASGLAARSWVWVTATVEVKFHTLYKGVGPILTAVNVQPAEPAEQEEAIHIRSFVYQSSRQRLVCRLLSVLAEWLLPEGWKSGIIQKKTPRREAGGTEAFAYADKLSLFRAGPHGDQRQPYRPSARLRAGCGCRSGNDGGGHAAARFHHPRCVRGLCPGRDRSE